MIQNQKKFIFGFSGITPASYFYWLNSSLLLDYKAYLIQVFVLLIFSLFFFGSAIFLIEKIGSKNKIIFKFFNLIFTTWIIVVAIKTIFYLSNFTTLPELITSILNIKKSEGNELINRTIIFSIPYIFIFFIVFIFANFIEKIKIFFSFLGIVLIFLLTFNIASEILFKHKIHKLNADNIGNIKKGNDKKIIWVVFDEFDPQIAFNKNNYEIMKNFNNFKNLSVYFPNFYSTAKNTLYSMTSTLLGKPIKNLKVKKRIILVDDGKELTSFSFKNTIFYDLNKKGYTFKILSSVFPYCYHLNLPKEDCLSIDMSDYSKFNSDKFAGVIFVFSPLKKFKRFIDLNKSNNLKEEKSKLNFINDINEIKNLEPTIKISEIKKFDDGILNFSNFENAIKSDKNFIFLHIVLPHTGKEGENFSKKIFQAETSGYLNRYVLNLKSADIILGKIISVINKHSTNNNLVILSSDHWFRNKDRTTSKSYPSLLLLKLIEDNENIVMDNKISSASINSLINNYIDGDLNSNLDLANFMKNQPFYETYSYTGDDFVKN